MNSLFLNQLFEQFCKEKEYVKNSSTHNSLLQGELSEFQVTLLVAWTGEFGSIWDEMIRSGQDEFLTRQDIWHIGNPGRSARAVPAVDEHRGYYLVSEDEEKQSTPEGQTISI